MTWRIEPPKRDSLFSCFCYCVKFRVRVSVELRGRVGFRLRVRVGFRVMVRVSSVYNIN